MSVWSVQPAGGTGIVPKTLAVLWSPSRWPGRTSARGSPRRQRMVIRSRRRCLMYTQPTGAVCGAALLWRVMKRCLRR